MNVFRLKKGKKKARRMKEWNDGRLESLPVFVAYNSHCRPLNKKKGNRWKRNKRLTVMLPVSGWRAELLGSLLAQRHFKGITLTVALSPQRVLIETSAPWTHRCNCHSSRSGWALHPWGCCRSQRLMVDAQQINPVVTIQWLIFRVHFSVSVCWSLIVLFLIVE